MPRIHVVKQGETLSSIAEQYGFLNYEGIWNAPENAGLRDVRPSGHVLFPGDEVVIPDKEVKSYDRATDNDYQFLVHVEKTKLLLHLEDALGKPLAGTPCVLTVDGQEDSLTTDGEGVLEASIPRKARKAKLEVNKMTWDIAIGHLDPPGARPGWLARLKNLGYIPADIAFVNDHNAAHALGRFQEDNDLPRTETMNQATCDKLLEVHGS
jgi:N-acetylmuramoyl-L-alanine amidase